VQQHCLNNNFSAGDGLPGYTLLGDDRGNAAECASEIRRNGSLHAHLDRFEWAESDVGNQFGGSTGGQIKRGFPFGGILLSDEITVELLKVLVSTILECSLGLFAFINDFLENIVIGWLSHTVAEESGTPTGEHTTEALGSTDRGEGLHVTLVELRINLAAAFDEIKRGHCRVSEALSCTISAVQVLNLNGL
jgi:hypothetical protein